MSHDVLVHGCFFHMLLGDLIIYSGKSLTIFLGPTFVVYTCACLFIYNCLLNVNTYISYNHAFHSSEAHSYLDLHMHAQRY